MPRPGDPPAVTRFAPTPSGYLHLGHAYSALLAWEAAHAGKGCFHLRIEDIDIGRCRPEFEQGILDDLRWLGLAWHGEPFRQSDHMQGYADALDRLDRLGVLYPCFCTRRQIRAEIADAGRAPHGPSGEALYPGICRALDVDERRRRIGSNEPFALRLDVEGALALTGPLSWQDLRVGEIQADPVSLGDVVLARKDVPTSYHLAVTIDDALQGVTLITRGEDLFHATHIHRLLQALLGLPTPDYYHHNLIADSTGMRIAKRNRAVTLRTLRHMGKQPADVWRLIGLPEPEPASPPASGTLATG
ncbi:MAG: tRNA glutamyl-Q(34) synthetase GluQRS [Alphaproteobacteria bacterium]|nr:tRNA glutamyl-Q(34) synthetase GluQRS [Alphaproteobacteria bacterium]